MKKMITISLGIILFFSACKKKDDDAKPVEPSTTLKSLLANGEKVQDVLNKGFTPLQIYTNDNTYLDSLYGKTYSGGLIFQFDKSDGSGLVATTKNQSVNQEQWGCTGILTNATNNTFGGAKNTTDILAVCNSKGIAADLCASLELNGYKDWYLPTLAELNEMYKKLHKRKYGDFTGNVYWSSTERGANHSYTVSFFNGSQTWAVKSRFHFVRAIRIFKNN